MAVAVLRNTRAWAPRDGWRKLKYVQKTPRLPNIVENVDNAAWITIVSSITTFP